MHLSANILEIKGQLTRQSVIASQKVTFVISYNCTRSASIRLGIGTLITSIFKFLRCYAWQLPAENQEAT